MMTRITSPAIFPAITIGVLAMLSNGFAEDHGPFVRKGRLIEKLIVVKEHAEVRVDVDSGLGGGVEAPKPFSLFWRLKTGTPGDEKDGYYLAGNAVGEPVCWIKRDFVLTWTSRLLLDPVVPDSGRETGFAVYLDPKGTRKSMEIVGGAAGTPRRRHAAIILGPSGTEEARADSLFPVACFTANLEAADGAGTGGDGLEKAIPGLGPPGLEFVFVIDTTGDGQPLVDMAAEAVRAVRQNLAKSPSLRGAIRIGLVEYRDRGEDFVSKVTLPLTPDLEAIQRALAEAQCRASVDYPEAVTAGCRTATQPNGLCYLPFRVPGRLYESSITEFYFL